MPNKLENQLSRQLGYLERSCMLFDQGYKDEAIRIAVTLRTLFHDTYKPNGKANSVSLLTLLGIKDNTTIKSACPHHEVVNRHRMFAWDPLTIMDDDHNILPLLGKNKKTWSLLAEEWWQYSTSVIIVPGICVSRKDIVLAAANKDGGTHVNKKYPEKYEYLNRGFWRTGQKCHNEHQFTLLRHFAFEVLNSEDLTKNSTYVETEC